MKYIFIFIFFLSSIARAYCQISIENPLEKDTTENEYIETYPRTFMGRYIIADKALRLEVREKGDSEKSLKYEPYGTGFIGFGGIYGKIGLEVLMRVPVRSDFDFEKRGTTRSFDLQMNQYGRKIGIDILVQRYKGFYLRNPEELYNGWTRSDAFPQRSDIISWKAGFNVYHIFNHKRFSLRSSFIQTERQKKSSGSFIIMSSLFRVTHTADSSIIPNDLDIQFNPDSYFRKGSYYSIAFLPGYAHTFVANRFYLTLSLFLGAGLQWQRYEVDKNTKKSYSIKMKTNIRSALGYNGEKIFVGVSYVNDNSAFNVNDIEVVTKSNNFKIFAGMRF